MTTSMERLESLDVLASQLATVTLPDDHEIEMCWNPRYHGGSFKRDSAYVLLSQEARGKDWRVVPLCIFGGVSFSRYVYNESANGTWAVCPSCLKVMMCGYSDNAGLSPRKCEECGTQLEMGDYFQLVKSGSQTEKSYLINPGRDPAVTIAETCALVPGGVPRSDLVAVIAVLASEGLLRAGAFIDDFRIDSYLSRMGYVTSEAVQERLTPWSSPWVRMNSATPKRDVQTTPHGRLMLAAREIFPTVSMDKVDHWDPEVELAVAGPAQDRLTELLMMDDEQRQALGQKVLAEAVLARY